MNPLKPQQLYQRVAEKLNLPEDYVKDLVEHYYMTNKTEMFNLSHVIFKITGLGRFIIRPMKFWRREKNLLNLIEKFKDRRDDRGIMIRLELERRYQAMQDIKPEVQKYYDLRKERMYGKAKNDLEE